MDVQFFSGNNVLLINYQMQSTAIIQILARPLITKDSKLDIFKSFHAHYEADVTQKMILQLRFWFASNLRPICISNKVGISKNN